MLTIKDVKSIVKEFQEANQSHAITREQKVELYRMLNADYQNRPRKNNMNTKKLGEPMYSTYGRRGLLIWPCDMQLVESSFIVEIGYCETEKVLKIVTQGNAPTAKTYAYAYHDVPADRYEEFLEADDKGVYYNRRIKGRFPVVGLV